MKLGIVVGVGLALGILYLRLAAGPLSFGHLPERVAASLAARIGPGWKVAVRNTALQLENGSLALRATGLDIWNPDDVLVLRAPLAIVSVDGLSLLTANLQPRSIEFRDVQLRASVNRDGSLSFTPSPEAGQGEVSHAPEPPSPSQPAAASLPADRKDVSPVSVAAGSLFELIVGPQGILGALDRARVTNARLTLVDARQRERATFGRVNAIFDRTDAGGRRFDATLDGPGGVWRLTGDALADGHGGYHASVVATDVPVQDLLLLSGLSAVPATTDLKFSGRADAGFAGGRVVELKARLTSNAGYIQIEDKDTSPLPVEKMVVDAAWDEGRRTLVMSALELTGGDTRLRLQGELSVPSGEPGWRLALNGRDATLAGAAAGDRVVRIEDIDLRVAGRDGIVLESLKLKGPNLAVDLAGSFGQGSDPRSLNLDLRAVNTDVRSALRLWPEAVAPPVRKFLVRSLKGGSLYRMNLKVAMSGADFAKANSGGPIPDGSLRADFVIAQGVLAAAEGLPPLTQAAVMGMVTGTKAAIRAPTGRVEMPDGRALAASEGEFILDDFWPDDAVARIGFKLKGGADALGSLLRAPLIREIAGIDLDPATIKGSTDLRVTIPLAINNIPKFADLPLMVAGTVNDLSVDKLFGKDRFEAGNLTVAYDSGDLSIRGDGKLAGNVATLDVRRSREAGGEANLFLTLDDAARARKGLAFGSQLTGPVALKATLPLGKEPKPGIRVEADLAKATVEQLIPGWAKPAGRPGKFTFTLVEGVGSEIRDLQLDSGSVQLRGSAALSSEGSLERAELTTVKFSPGDDMRAQIERTNGTYKVTVRGNVGDARPFIKAMSAAPAAGRGAAQAQRDSKDVDLDLALNILTGHNDEAITSASIKASIKRDNIRQLDIKGRLGTSNVMAQTVPKPGGSAAILMQAEDAGAMLRFLDLYRRMAGGDMVVQVNTGDGPQAGFLTINDFILRNEPALRRIIPTQTQVVSAQDRAGNMQAIRIDVNQVSFAKARVDFTRTSGRVDFKDAAIWGNQVGFTLGGYLDYARDKTDIAGTFVPAYGLNNAFAQVPLVGPILGGGRYEGLFAVNFRISGAASAPVLSVNPLSAVAPGFLRKLFGAGAAPQSGASPAPMPLPER